MSVIDYQQVAKQIAEERPEEFRVSMIRVNFDHIEDGKIPPRIRKRVQNRFEEIAQPILNYDLAVIEDSDASVLWDYDIKHTCGGFPMYDEVNEEFYCPNCESEEEQKGILDF